MPAIIRIHCDLIPERWTPEAKAARPRFSYFPFGGGSRQCIGESFAWMEGILLVATLAQRWRMRLLPGPPGGAASLGDLASKVWDEDENRTTSCNLRST